MHRLDVWDRCNARPDAIFVALTCAAKCAADFAGAPGYSAIEFGSCEMVHKAVGQCAADSTDAEQAACQSGRGLACVTYGEGTLYRSKECALCNVLKSDGVTKVAPDQVAPGSRI